VVTVEWATKDGWYDVTVEASGPFADGFAGRIERLSISVQCGPDRDRDPAHTHCAYLFA
jgi:hypothetical protein